MLIGCSTSTVTGLTDASTDSRSLVTVVAGERTSCPVLDTGDTGVHSMVYSICTSEDPTIPSCATHDPNDVPALTVMTCINFQDNAIVFDDTQEESSPDYYTGTEYYVAAAGQTAFCQVGFHMNALCLSTNDESNCGTDYTTNLGCQCTDEINCDKSNPYRTNDEIDEWVLLEAGEPLVCPVEGQLITALCASTDGDELCVNPLDATDISSMLIGCSASDVTGMTDAASGMFSRSLVPVLAGERITCPASNEIGTRAMVYSVCTSEDPTIPSCATNDPDAPALTVMTCMKYEDNAIISDIIIALPIEEDDGGVADGGCQRRKRLRL